MNLSTDFLLLCLVIYHYLHLAYYFKGKLCNASFMFDEFFCGGGWWLVDFTSTTFRFILLLVGGYLTRFFILGGVFYLFVMGP